MADKKSSSNVATKPGAGAGAPKPAPAAPVAAINKPAGAPPPAAPKATAPIAPVSAKPLNGKTVSAAERGKLIAEAAYYLAQQRGFSHGQDMQDWLAAEKSVDAQLNRRA